MSYFICYAVEDSEEPVEGDDVASTTGWLPFSDWGVELDADKFPQLRYLAWHGEIPSKEDIEALEKELVLAVKERPGKPDANLLRILKRLLGIIKARPAKADAFVITDGTGPESEEEDDD